MRRAVGAAATVVLLAIVVARTETLQPSVENIPLPDFWGAHAIWGAVGSDSNGRIWFGVSSNDDKSGSAHLFRYDPADGSVTEAGDVVTALKRAKKLRDGEKQMKIHSRIVRMPDGYLYFASMDESGENPDGSRLPTWGGHLWRIGPPGRWEHLLAAKEALIAVAAGGRFVYALGYFGHVLYQYDTRTRRVNTKTVGAAGGHVSRNIFGDDRGHVFVPRVVRTGETTWDASLVELDSSLTELASTPLQHYFERRLQDSHGIVAVHADGSGGWLFTTGKGRLYHVQPQGAGPSVVADKGWFHPGGSRYVATMFRSADGSLHAVTPLPKSGGRGFEWVTRPPAGPGAVAPFPYGRQATFPNIAGLYGSMAQDRDGRFYVAGTMKYKPVLLQVALPATAR